MSIIEKAVDKLADEVSSVREAASENLTRPQQVREAAPEVQPVVAPVAEPATGTYNSCFW